MDLGMDKVKSTVSLLQSRLNHYSINSEFIEILRLGAWVDIPNFDFFACNI